MKKYAYLAVLGAAAFAPSAAMAQAIDTAPSGYSLVWSDEFNGTTLDENTWNIEVNGNGGGNQELQYYRRENVSLGADPATGDHCLILTAKRENYQGKSFTSGRVTSRDKAAFKHGVLQARIKFPKTANGLWPAYWMMGNDMSRYGWPRCGEMDIIELGHFNGINAGTQDRYFSGTLHYGPDATNEHHQQLSQEYLAPEDNPATNDEYHIFTVEWDNENLYMYYDLNGWGAAAKRRTRYFSTTIPYSDEVMSAGHYFQKPFFFLFNLAVGGTYTNIYDPSRITALPAGAEAKMYVDWVRVYQADNDADAQYTFVRDGETVTNIPDEPEPEPTVDDKTPLSGFATKALDDNGVSTFDFADAYDYVLISTSGGVTGNALGQSNVLSDLNVNDDTRNLYIWENTYVPNGHNGKVNSFGWEEGYTSYSVASVGWSGLGFSFKDEDLSMIDDDYWLHFAMKGYDADLHASHTMTVGDAEFRIGTSDGKLATVGDFPRDGEWYYFDIPVKALRQFADPLFPAAKVKHYDENIVTFLSGGRTDAEICYDNIFFYKSHSKTVPTYTDTTSDLGQYGYKSLDADGQPVFKFDGVEDIVPLVLSGDTWESLTEGGTYGEGSLIKPEHDNSEQGGRNNFFIWGDPQTLTASPVENVANSFGRIPFGGFSAYASARKPGWNGAGWASIAGQGNNPQPKDLSMVDDSYTLHLSLRSDAAVGHVPVVVRLGSKDDDATLVFGSYSDKSLFADFPRDGEWYSYDIPVSVLKRYGKLWGEATNLKSYADYALCFNTMPTYYTGSTFSLDNVFFYKKGEAPVVDDLGPYATKSLDADGHNAFDFDQWTDYVVINAGASVLENMQGKIAANYAIDDQNVHLYLWEGTYEGADASATNSFGSNGGSIDLRITDKGWAGFGIIAPQDGVDVSMLDDTYYLHFAMRGTDQASHMLALGQAKFSIGFEPVVNDGAPRPVLGNYRRDGEWYSFDIPFSALRRLSTDIFPVDKGGAKTYKDNFFWSNRGDAQRGAELHIDNIFFYHAPQVEDGIVPQLSTFNPQPSYDLMGRRVQTPSRPGFYIVGGKKVIR